MTVYKKHIFICNQVKPPGIESCSAGGSDRLIELLKNEIERAGLSGAAAVTPCGCLGLCQSGPSGVIYPEGFWLGELTEKSIPGIIEIVAGKAEASPPDEAEAEKLRVEITAHFKKVAAINEAKKQSAALPDEFSGVLRAFQVSRVYLTAVELDLFTALGAGADATALAGKINVDARALEMLLNALVSLGALTTEGARFLPTPLVDNYLRGDSPRDARGAIGHINSMWRSWSTMTEAVRQGKSVVARKEWDDEDRSKNFIAAMQQGSALGAPAAIGALDLDGVKSVIDLGGGSAAYAIAFARAREDIAATVFDLPAIVGITDGYIKQAGMTDRVKTQAGDLIESTEYGAGFDLAFISSILHIFGPQKNIDILRKARAALNPGGRTIVREFILNEEKTGPLPATLFSLNMLVATEEGAAYTAEEISSWFGEAGYEGIEYIDLPGPTGMISGRNPG